jgi:hypothetical protein
MFAVLAGIVFIIAAVLAMFGPATLTLGHLLGVICIGLVLIAAHLAARVYAPERRW